VTSTTTYATSSDIAYYNSFVTSVANGSPELAALGTTWTAIASTLTVDARDNTNTNPASGSGVPIYNVGGLLVASDNTNLWQLQVANTISVTEDGSASTLYGAWTGSLADGRGETLAHGGRPFGDLVLGSSGGNSTSGYVFQPIGYSWVAGSVAGNALNQLPLYGISGILTVPEPGTSALLTLGLVAFGFGAIRRRSHLTPKSSSKRPGLGLQTEKKGTSMNRPFSSLLSVTLAGAVVALAAVAFADVPNNTFQIPFQDGAAHGEGFVGAADDHFRAGAAVVCSEEGASGPEGTTIIFISNHPDLVQIKNEKALTGQVAQGNPADVIVRTGGGADRVSAQLTCASAQVRAGVTTNKSPIQGAFSAKASSCRCVPTDFDNDMAVCDAHNARLNQIATDCDGLKSTGVGVGPNEIEQLTIKGKSDAEEGGEF
jgi:PEP-CTERM motif